MYHVSSNMSFSAHELLYFLHAAAWRRKYSDSYAEFEGGGFCRIRFYALVLRPDVLCFLHAAAWRRKHSNPYAESEGDGFLCFREKYREKS